MPTVALGDVAQFVNGLPFKPEEWRTDGRPIIRIQNLTDPSKPFNYTKRVVDDRYLVQVGDLLVSWSATLGVFVWAGPANALLNQHIFRVIPDEHKVEKRYLCHALVRALSDMGRHLHGATMKHVNRGEFLGTKIALPTLSEQRRIANILDKASTVRHKRKQTIDLTEELLRSAFLDMFGDPMTNPKGWDVKPLGNYLGFVTSGSRGWAEHYTEKGDRFIRSLDVQMGRISEDDAAYVVAPPGAEAERTRVQEDDVLLTITGSKIGRAARATATHANAYVSQHVAILRFLPGLDPDVVTAFLISDRGGQALIASSQYGQTKPGLNLSQIREFPIPVPPQKVQARIRAMRCQVSASQERLVAAQHSTEDLFACLVQRTFSEDLKS